MEIKTRYNTGDMVNFYSKKFDRILTGEVLTINISVKRRGWQEINYLIKAGKIYENINELAIRI